MSGSRVFTHTQAVHDALSSGNPGLKVDAASLNRPSPGWRKGELGEQVGARVTIGPDDTSFSILVAEDCTAHLVLWVGDEPVVAFPASVWPKGSTATCSEFPIVLCVCMT